MSETATPIPAAAEINKAIQTAGRKKRRFEDDVAKEVETTIKHAKKQLGGKLKKFHRELKQLKQSLKKQHKGGRRSRRARKSRRQH